MAGRLRRETDRSGLFLPEHSGAVPARYWQVATGRCLALSSHRIEPLALNRPDEALLPQQVKGALGGGVRYAVLLREGLGRGHTARRLPAGDLRAQQVCELEVQRFPGLMIKAHVITVNTSGNPAIPSDPTCPQVLAWGGAHQAGPRDNRLTGGDHPMDQNPTDHQQAAALVSRSWVL